jgi:hypothetical protein
MAVVAALAGAVLFAYAIRNVGWEEVAAGVGRVGWGLLPILALSGIRFVLRAEAWRQCMPAAVRLPLPQALAAYLAGDAIGNVTPLGLIASEPTKVFLTRHRLATREAASSLAIDVFVYSMSVGAMIGLGLMALLVTVPLSPGWREAIVIALILLAITVPVAWRLLGGTWSAERGARPRWRARLASLREAVLAFSATDSARLRRVFLLHVAFHTCAFLEIFLALRWLLADAPAPDGSILASQGPTLAQTLIFSALDRVVIVLFKFVPFRIGVDEASSGGIAAVLGWSPATGVALAIVKKVRSLVWTGVGLLLIATHPAQAVPAAGPRESARAPRT